MQEPGEGLPLSQNRKWDFRVILLELVIVFVGLFAALQLENFREQRAFIEAQERILVRMQEDLEEFLSTSEMYEDFQEYLTAAVSHVHDSLVAGEILSGNTELFEHGIIFFAHLPTLPLPRSTYEEMVASGMFSALDSEGLKKEISRLFFYHDFVESNFEWWRTGTLEFESVMEEWVEYYSDENPPPDLEFLSRDPNRRVRYDFDELSANLRIRNGFYWAQDSARDWWMFTRDLRQIASRVNEMILEELNRDKP